MKLYIGVDVTSVASTFYEKLFDDEVLKDFAFTAKYKKPVLKYSNVLVPILKLPEQFEYLDEYKNFANDAIDNANKENLKPAVVYSLYKAFEGAVKYSAEMKIKILFVLKSENMGITYTDGSSRIKEKLAGYGCCKLLENDESGLYDPVSDEKRLYKTFSGKITNGTNNIGELTGIKTAVENFDEKQYQVIVSDSMYSIKTFREYIHVWEQNHYMAANKKPIKNKDLICNIKDKIDNSKKYVFFKWTKGHDASDFNNKCDELAGIAVDE